MNAGRRPFRDIFVALLAGGWLAGCAADSPLGILFSPPDCSIVYMSKYDPDASRRWPEIELMVHNRDDNSTAFSVGCTFKLKRGNVIIDRGFASFGALEPGEAALATVRFTGIESHREYSDLEYTLFWYDAQGGYYEN